MGGPYVRQGGGVDTLGAATLKHALIREAVGRTHGAHPHLGIDKPAAGGQQLPIEFQQIHLRIFASKTLTAVAGKRHSVSSSRAPIITIFATLVEPKLSAISAAGMQITRRRGQGGIRRQPVAVVKDEAAGLNLVSKFAQRDLVHGDQHAWMRDKGRTDGLH